MSTYTGDGEYLTVSPENLPPGYGQTAEPVKRHCVKTDIAWMGSGRDGDPWVMSSWDTEWCDCDRPWRHGWLA